MGSRTARWLRRAGLVLVGISIAVAVVARTVDVKKWVRSQLAIPHGASGWLAALTMPMAHKVFYAPAADLLQLQPDDELVEVGCGSGAFLVQHASHVERIAGLDASSIQVHLAQRRLADRIESGTAEIVEGDAVALPWGDASFSAAACMGSLDYFSDPRAALEELWRVLRPGGRLVVSYGVDPADADTMAMFEEWGLPTPSEEEARKIVEGSGFSLVGVTYLEGDFPARFITAIKPE